MLDKRELDFRIRRFLTRKTREFAGLDHDL